MSIKSSFQSLKKIIKELETEIDGIKTISDFSDGRTRIVHEYNLINNRINWMLTSQTIFFGIFAIIITDSGIKMNDYNNFEILIPWLSIITAILIYVSILAAVFAIRKFAKDAGDWKVTGFKATYYAGLVAPLSLPLIFILAWVFIIYPNYYVTVGLIVLIVSAISILFYRTKSGNYVS